jgi:V/A-type H+-transporting ATPase subunit F
MERNSIAAYGDKAFATAFKAVGVEAYTLGSEDPTEKLKELGRTCAVIFVTEEIATSASALIERYKSRAYPVILPLPGAAGSAGIGMENIRKDIERAIGNSSILG